MDKNTGEYKRRTMSAYDAQADELAEGFDHYFDNHGRLEAEIFLSKLNEGSAILDIGCGVGTASKYFLHQKYSPYCADLSYEMLKVCQGRGLYKLVRLDLEELPFEYSTFDGIWAHTSLIHIRKERIGKSLDGIGRALKAGGALFISLLEGEGERYEERNGEKSWFAYFKEGEFSQYVPEWYQIMKVGRVEIPNWTFLNFHLIKKDENNQF